MDLAEAAERYRQAGLRALEQQLNSDWWQLYLQFEEWNRAERVFVDHIAPVLQQAQRDGLVDSWWFMRKHPCWRLRIVPGPARREMKPRLTSELDALTEQGQLAAWWSGIYEAETGAFGGQAAMDLAHALFCADSHAITEVLGDNAISLGRRELSVLLCTSLMRAAGVERYEQADVWQRVAQERRTPAVRQEQLASMTSDLAQLLHADTSSDSPLWAEDGPLTAAAPWVAAFHQAGRGLGTAARAGTLQRGLRDVIAYHVIFHWNRLGLPARTQNILAEAAQRAILGHTPPTPSPALAVAREPRSPVHGPTEHTHKLARHFPLVAHGQRRCPNLETRIHEVAGFADTHHVPADPEERINRACSAWNLAALIAADCGMPQLAAELCREQFLLFQQAWPVSARRAITALQPLINLARLTKRAGNYDTAHAEFESINQAAHHGGTITVHALTTHCDDLLLPDIDRSVLSRYLHGLLRDEGTRALAAAGMWQRAADHAARYDDTHQLRQARQTQIIAEALNGNADSALQLLDSTTQHEPWETAAALCLRTFVQQTAGRAESGDMTGLLQAIQQARRDTQPSTLLFSVRLGLAGVDLTTETTVNTVDALCTDLITQAERSSDAFAAREILKHPTCRAHATPTQTAALTGLVDSAGLDSGELSPAQLTELIGHVDTARRALIHALDLPHAGET